MWWGLLKLEKATTKLKKDKLICEKCILKKDKELIPFATPKRLRDPEPDKEEPFVSEVTGDPMGDKDEKTDSLEDDGETFDETDPLPDLPDDSDLETKDAKKPGRTSIPERKEEPIVWRRGGLIGVGAFGKVYEAMNTKTGELIAVKQVTLDESSPGSSEIVQEIQNEIDLMKKLRHRNIVGFFGTERDGPTLSILMEFVPGKSLDHILSKYGALREEVICNYTKQILLALEYCHAKKIVHRDIKGKNILVDKTGCLKLADFGSAKAFAGDWGKEKGEKFTPGHTYNYTPLWTAPEVLVGDYDNKVDVWSLGCVIIEMASGKPPWSEQNFENPFRALYHIGKSNAIPKLPDHLSETALEFLKACLQRDPDQRPNASDLLKT